MFINYKGFDKKSHSSAPELEDIIDNLYSNTSACFAEDNESDEDYVIRLVTFLHKNLKHCPRTRLTVSSSPKAKRARNIVFIKDIPFCDKKVEPIYQMQNRWELFILYDNVKHTVCASCLVHFNDVYHTCEIHEVCVATSGKGYCQQILKDVKHHICKGLSGPMADIRIYCERQNIAACKCYARTFATSTVITTDATIGYIYNIPSPTK